MLTSMPAMAEPEHTWEYSLRKYLLLLASLVATVTYGVGFSPPGGVWEDTVVPAGHHAGHLAGDPIIQTTSNPRYVAFFYCNATAFASSLVVIVLILLLAVVHEKEKVWVTVLPLRVVMVLDLLSLMGAYAAGTCRDTFSTVYSSLLVAAVSAYLVVQMVLASFPDKEKNPGTCDGGGGGGELMEERPRKVPMLLPGDEPIEERLRKVLMLLATFAVSVTYVAGLSTPGGFWTKDGGDHRAGDAVLKGRYGARLMAFFMCNTTAFVASLLIIVVLLDGKLRAQRTVRSRELYGCIVVALACLFVAYAAGGCREADTTVYVLALVGAVLAFIIVLYVSLVSLAPRPENHQHPPPNTITTTNNVGRKDQQLNQARSLVLLLATLAATITYQAGLDPPGGLWEDNDIEGRYTAGDPILLTMDAGRYNVFFYCNSVAFVASLVTIVLVQNEDTLKHHALEAAMVLDLFGLIGAYAAGSCRDVSTSVYVMALAGAVLVYVVIHVIFFTLDDGKTMDEDELVAMEKRRKRLLLFAILAATITYQAGMTPPGGFVDSGERAGDSVLSDNFPRRYNAFFYCNSVSFMLSVALIMLLVNPNLYRPAIRSYALSVCTAAELFGLMGAYAAGSTQHLKTSIYVFVLVAVVVFFVLLLLLVFLVRELKKEKENITSLMDTATPDHDQLSSGQQVAAAHQDQLPSGQQVAAAHHDQLPSGQQVAAAHHDQLPSGQQAATAAEAVAKKIHAKRKYLMLLGILVASVTYQAGLDPPGGFWQIDDGEHGHAAGNPVMHDRRRSRYLVFFYSNSTSFEASIVVIVLLLLPDKSALQRNRWWLRVMNTTVVLDLLGLLVAYAAGSNRHWRTSVYVVVLVAAVLVYIAVHVMLSFFCRRARRVGRRGNHSQLTPIQQPQELQGRGEHQHQQVQGDDPV